MSGHNVPLDGFADRWEYIHRDEATGLQIIGRAAYDCMRDSFILQFDYPDGSRKDDEVFCVMLRGVKVYAFIQASCRQRLKRFINLQMGKAQQSIGA